jgi:pyruvate/2-oxoglutarate dehydrogenase complex dihydrolipoamide acyltransferase (E2) component
MSDSAKDPGYSILPANKFFEANRRIVEWEIRPSHTVTLMHEVDLTQVERIRKQAEKAGHPKPSPTAFVAKAVALALRAHPCANRRICRRAWLPLLNPRVQEFTNCDIAIAVEREVPGAESVAFVDVLRQADQRPLDDMTRWLRELATCDVTNNKQWRDFSRLITRLPQSLSSRLIRLPYISPSAWVKYRGGAVLISSPGKYGPDAIATTWSWPLGVSFGFIKERPVVRGGKIVPCPTFHLTVNFDRRIMAGAPAARFVDCIVKVLENAETQMVPYLPASTAHETLALHGSNEDTAVPRETRR